MVEIRLLDLTSRVELPAFDDAAFQDAMLRARDRTAKWDGRWNCEVRDGSFFHRGGDFPVLVYSVTPAKVLAFGQGTFTHTTHRF